MPHLSCKKMTTKAINMRPCIATNRCWQLLWLSSGTLFHAADPSSLHAVYSQSYPPMPILISHPVNNGQTTALLLWLIVITVLAYSCLHGSAPAYLASELFPVSRASRQQRLQSLSTTELAILRVNHHNHATLGSHVFGASATSEQNIAWHPYITVSWLLSG